MAVLIMFTVLAVIVEPIKSQEKLMSKFTSGSQYLALNNDQTKTPFSIKHSLLYKLNKLSDENSQKLVMLKPSNNIYQTHLQRADEIKYQTEPRLGHSYSISEIEPSNQTFPMSNSIWTEANDAQRNAKIMNDWEGIRERRLRFYKEFRKIQNLKGTEEKYHQDRNFINANKTIDIDKGNSIDPANATFSDWETFLTDYGKVMPQYHRRHAISNEYATIDTSNVRNPFSDLSTSMIRNTVGYDPQIRQTQSYTAAQNPISYQQNGRNLNFPYNEVKTTEYHPLPVNSASAEASVGISKAYPSIQQQPYSIDYHDKNTFPNGANYQRLGYHRFGIRENRNDYEKQSISQLMLSQNHNIDGTATTSQEFDCNDTSCEYANANLFGSNDDEQCNSPRLKQIILQNIIGNDAESSKHAIYNVCEAEMEVPCNVICGTGFYTYLARTTQFCLITTVDITCYVFLPACDFNTNFIQKS